ncbi:MAG: hypothetical protein ACK5UE_08785 [Chitinophagales bacterium]|jgi:hypothetical protein
MKHIFIFSILFSFCATSCYTLKPDSEFATSPNYNNQVTVTKPKFVKKNNPIGISIQIATPIIAGAAMYQFAPSVVQYQSGAETKNFHPANAAIGILGMLAINKIVNYAFGYNRVKPMRTNDVDKWMKKTNLQEKYNYIAETEGYKIQLIPKTQESDFTVKSAQDVLHFKALFPLASQENIAKVIQSGTTNLSHEDLTTLVHYYPNHEAVNATKIKYIETARNYTELWDRINKYTETKVDREQLSANLIVLEKEYDNFKSKIPNSSYASVIEKKLIDIDNRSFAEFSSINTKDGYRQYLNKFLRPHNKELALLKIAEIEEEDRRIAEQKRLEEIARQEQARKEREAAEERERNKIRDIQNGTYNGYVEYQYPNFFYKGYVENGVPHGQGEYTDFENDCSQKTYVKGTFKNGRPDGKCFLQTYYKNCTREYDGDVNFNDGRLHGSFYMKRHYRMGFGLIETNEEVLWVYDNGKSVSQTRTGGGGFMHNWKRNYNEARSESQTNVNNQKKQCYSSIVELTGDKRHKCGNRIDDTYKIECSNGNTVTIFQVVKNNDKSLTVCGNLTTGAWHKLNTGPNDFLSNESKEDAIKEVCKCK